MRRIRDRLRAEYGRPMLRAHRKPIDELVLTVLSQNTNDRNRDLAYARMRERFGSWAEVRDAPLAELEDALRPGGLAPTKAGRIQQILREIGDDDLEEAAGALAPGTSAAVLVWENRWAAPVAVALRRSGGQLVASGRIPIQAILASLDAVEATN